MTTWTGTVPTIAAGDTTTVPANLATYRDILKALTEAWTSFTPTVANWTPGNGVWTARYAQMGKSVFFRIHFAAGTTTTYTATQMQINLPVAIHGTGLQAFQGRLLSTSGAFIICATVSAGLAIMSLETPVSTARSDLIAMTSTSPNPGTTGFLEFQGVYEAA